MSNLNALVDSFLHPKIPYFDKEHLIVGSITGLLSSILFVVLFLYSNYLKKAIDKIRKLESYLTVCASCKKISIPNSDRKNMKFWIPIEDYITKKTSTEFSHGICPDCTEKFYSNSIK